jgi:carbamoyl-phosphate synthase large subunit
VQVFYEEESSSLEVIEINPRLGGGFPIADKAGGRFIEWLVQEYIDQQELKAFAQWTDGLYMMC